MFSTKRTPSWTDRIMYTTYTDSPTAPDKSNIVNILYTSIPSYVTSDHVRPLHISSARDAACLSSVLLMLMLF